MHHQRRTHYVTARDGTRLAYHAHLPHEGAPAPDRPTLLLTNGVGTTDNFWKHVTATLAHDHHVLHWDYRGHGESERATGGDYALRTHADDLIRVTDQAMADGRHRVPAVHVGFSMGVAVLLEAYRVRPDLFRALVLIAGTPDAPYATTLPFRLPGVMPLVRAALAAATPALPVAAPLAHAVMTSPLAYPAARALGLLQRRAPREEIEVFTRGLARMDPRAYWYTLRGLMAARASDVLPLVREPVLIIAAERDVLAPPSQVEKMRRGLPGARIVTVPDAGHAGLVEAGPEMAASIRLFVRSVVESEEPFTPARVARAGGAGGAGGAQA